MGWNEKLAKKLIKIPVRMSSRYLRMLGRKLQPKKLKTVSLRRCFGLLLAPGKNVDNQKMHLLDQVFII